MIGKMCRIVLMPLVILVAVGIGTASAQDAVVVQLNWVHDSSFAGFYMAEDMGLYEAQGLSVDLQIAFDEEGNFRDSVSEVASGSAQFGVADSATLLQARADGIPVVAIASNFQRNPLGFVSLAEQDILTPDDLVGKTVAISEYNVFMFEALLAVYDIDPSEVNIVERLDYTTAPLVSGEVDVIDAWVTNEMSTLDAQGIEANAIFPFEYGVDMYPDVLFTSEEVIENNPELVEAFLAATLAGIQMSVDDPDTAAEHVLSRDENFNIEELSVALSRAVPFFSPAGNPPGMMDSETWDVAQDVMLDTGVLEAETDLESAFTLAFLNAIYGEN